MEYAFQLGYRPLEFSQALVTTELDNTSFKSFFQLLAHRKISAMGLPEELKNAPLSQQQNYLDDINEVSFESGRIDWRLLLLLLRFVVPSI